MSASVKCRSNLLSASVGQPYVYVETSVEEEFSLRVAYLKARSARLGRWSVRMALMTRDDDGNIFSQT